MYIISGPNGSGKTTASYSILPELLDCSEFVNSDEFAKHLSPFAPEGAYITASRLMLKKVQYLFDRREDFCIETTLATRALIKMTRKAQELGVEIIDEARLMSLLPETAAQEMPKNLFQQFEEPTLF